MNLKDSLDKKIFTTIGAIADSMGRECYAVGGYVRDIIIGRPSKDIDFVTVGSGIELAEAVAQRLRPPYVVGRLSQLRHGAGAPRRPRA